jgi:hypothetical protein
MRRLYAVRGSTLIRPLFDVAEAFQPRRVCSTSASEQPTTEAGKPRLRYLGYVGRWVVGCPLRVPPGAAELHQVAGRPPRAGASPAPTATATSGAIQANDGLRVCQPVRCW